MAVTKKQKNCIHTYQATSRKVVLKVEAVSKSPKAKPVKLDVVATVFKCSNCGAKKEYPDMWEPGYRLVTIEKVVPI